MMRLSVVFLLSLVVLSGCSLFSKKDKEEEKREPVKLTSFEEEVRLRSLWDTKIGKGAEDKAIRLMPALAGGRVFAASANGNVVALQESNGREIWRIRIRSVYADDEVKNAFSDDVDQITGGVGVGAGLVVVGTAAGEIVALNQSDGSLAWRAKTSSEVLAPPQIAPDLVVAQSIDGRVAGFDVLSGERRWVYTTQIPSLTLRGTSTPIVTNDFVAAAFSNGRIVLLDPERGIAAFDERIASATGRSDLERLIDIDGNMVQEGRMLYAVGFQGRLVALDLSQGRFLWAEEASSLAGLGSGFGNLYVSFADSRLGAIDMDTGRGVWETDALQYRELTAPVAVSSFVAVGDYAGYLHLLAQSDGRFVGRRRIDGEGIFSPPVVDGTRLYVMGDSGRLSALEIQ